MPTANVSKLNIEHPRFADMKEFWAASDLLYRGGKAIQDSATRFLLKRPKELNDIYLQRVQRFYYDNIVGTALGWYQSTVFRKDPDIDIRVKGKDATAKPPDAKTAFYKGFLQNCDRTGTTYIDLWRQIFLSELLFKEAWVCVDLPGSDPDAVTLLDAKQKGLLNPYVMVYDPRHVINYEYDSYGNLAWVVIKVFSTRQEFLGGAQSVERWYYYDKTDYRVYERVKKRNAGDERPIELVGPNGQALVSDGGAVAELIDEGRHALAKYNQVPVRRFWIPDGLWLMQRAFLPACGHINIQNSYFWALFMANLPIPVIKSDSDFMQTLSESAFIQLDSEASFEWTEPAGTSFKHSADCLSAIREEIYRQMYLQAQGRDSSASASASSGYSKEMDMMPSKDIMGQFGDILRADMQALLGDIALAHGDQDLEFDVHGFTFSQEAAVQMIEMMEFASDSGIQSDDWYTELETRTALACVPDANRGLVETIIKQIKNGPKKSERDAAEMAAQKTGFTNTLQRAAGSVAQRAAAA